MSGTFGGGPPDPDDRLLDELGRALDPDPLPDGLIERATGLVAFTHADRELAALLEDAAAPAGTRGPATEVERLEFEVGDGSLALELAVGREALTGQVLSGTLTEVTLESLDGDAVTSRVDELGRFGFGRVPAGPVRLRLGAGPARPVATDWFLLRPRDAR